MFETERTIKIEVCAIFYYRSMLLNLSNFTMNLIEVFNILQFCCNLNLLLPNRNSSTVSLLEWFKMFSPTDCNSF